MHVEALLCFLLLSPFAVNVTVTPGIMLKPPTGYYAYNLAPTLNSTDNGPIYDPNFVPGFRAGLTNISLHWDTGPGYAHIGYSIGPWDHLQVGIPHLAVGPQCCNFKEIPRTQQYRAEDWGDYYYVKAGFLPPGVNMPNYTTDFSAPAYVGLRTDWQWVVSVSLDWKTPSFLNTNNKWAAIGLTATQYVPVAPNKLVYTVVNFWMDDNSTKVFETAAGLSREHMVAGSHIVVYHPFQLSEEGNQTITVNLSPYLESTLNLLNFTTSESAPPVVSYVYLNVEGYNFQWNTAMYSFFVLSDHSPLEQSKNNSPVILTLLGASIVIAFSIIGVAAWKLKKRDK